MSATALRAPFPYAGGQRLAAPIVWSALGDPARYVEPFCGSAAVLLNRPGPVRPRHELINDLDGFITNAWRAIRDRPAEVANQLDVPLVEVEVHARQAWLDQRGGREFVDWLAGDPGNCDPVAAAYWVYAQSAAIGGAMRPGPWVACGGVLTHVDTTDVRGRATGRGVSREYPDVRGGQGVFRWSIADMHDYMLTLSERLRHVRIMCGDWTRVLKPSFLDPRQSAGVFLDPPYTQGNRAYATTRNGEGKNLPHEVRQWCLNAPEHVRIVLAGYDTDHDALLHHGWTKVLGKAGGTGLNKGRSNHKRERLWLSPSCNEGSALWAT